MRNIEGKKADVNVILMGEIAHQGGIVVAEELLKGAASGGGGVLVGAV